MVDKVDMVAMVATWDLVRLMVQAIDICKEWNVTVAILNSHLDTTIVRIDKAHMEITEINEDGTIHA